MRLDKNNIKNRISGSFIETLGIQFIETEDSGSIEATLVVLPNLTQTTGVLHGGALISLADTVAGVGSNTLCHSDEYTLGLQISTSLISSGILNETLRAKGHIIHKGHSTHVWNVEIISENTGKLIASVTITNMVLKRK